MDLLPIVIPPMEHTYKSIKFTCSGENLYKDGYLYDPRAEKLIPPNNTKAGAAPKEVEKKPVAYWKAQCAFRGLNQTGAIADLQLRLREAKRKILPELKNAQSELNKEFKKKNIAARKDSWSGASVEQKAKTDPKRYLTETFPKKGSGRPANLDIVVLKLGANDRLAVSDAAEGMGLESVSVDAPWTSNKKPSPDRWVVIGRTRDSVWDQMRDIEREVGRSKQTFGAEKTKSQPTKSPKPAATNKKEPKSTPKPAQKNASSVPNKEAKSNPISKPPKQEAKSSNPQKAVPRMTSPLLTYSMLKSEGSRTKKSAGKNVFPEYGTPRHVKEESNEKPTASKSWDVRGSYEISCPAIDEQWSGNGMTLDLYLKTRNGLRQLYGAFDFNVIKGIMRFEKPIPVPKSEKGAEPSKKRKREDIDDNDDEDVRMELYPQYTGDDGGNYTEHAFYLGSDDKPTARRPTWRYRWRGHETGEGEIQLDSDKAVRSITFSDKGNTLSGYFSCDFLEECHFQGVKIRSTPRDQHVDPEAQWVNNSEEAHEYARVARWGGGRW